MWVDELIEAVDDLHGKFGIFHNDINPTNILVDEDTGNLIITGFGLSRPCNRNFSKMDYCRHLSDIDALCVTIYETLCTPGEFTRRVEMQGNQIVRGRIYNTHELLRTEWDVKAPLAELLTDEYEIRTKLREWKDGCNGNLISSWQQALQPLHWEKEVPWETTLVAADGSGKEIKIPSNPAALAKRVLRGEIYQGVNWVRSLPEPDPGETRPVYWEKWRGGENPRGVYISYFNETNYGIYRADKDIEL